MGIRVGKGARGGGPSVARSWAVSGMLAVGLAGVVAGTAAAQVPAPTAEHKALQYIVGTWAHEAELKPTPYMQGGKISGTEMCEAFAGGFHVVCRTKLTTSLGDSQTMAVMAYDGPSKAYSYYSINSSGLTAISMGGKKGGAWTYSSSYMANGAKMEARFTITEKGPTSYAYKWEMGPEGKLTVVTEGKGHQEIGSSFSGWVYWRER